MAWDAVDAYVTERLVGSDPALDAVLAAGLPDLHVSAAQGKFLHLLARIRGARTILEVGTLGGYSTIWLARALPPDGRLVTLERDPARAEVVRPTPPWPASPARTIWSSSTPTSGATRSTCARPSG